MKNLTGIKLVRLLISFFHSKIGLQNSVDRDILIIPVLRKIIPFLSGEIKTSIFFMNSLANGEVVGLISLDHCQESK